MNEQKKITSRQWLHILIYSNICVTPFALPIILYELLDQHAWFPIFLAYIVGLWNGFVTYSISKRFEKMTLVEWSKKLFGKFFGTLYSLSVILIFYLWGFLMIYIFLELIAYSQLPYTSRFVLLFFLIGVVLYLLLQGLEAWARWGELMAIFLIVALIFINIPQFMHVNVGYTMPLTTILSEPQRYFHFEVVATLFIFRAVFSLYFLYPYIDKKDAHILRHTLLGTTFSFLQIILAVLLPIFIFGATVASKLRFPYQESLETITFTVLPIDRISILTSIVWQLIIIYVLCISFFATARGFQSMFQLKNKNILYVVLSLLTLFLGLYPVERTVVVTLISYWSVAGLFLLMVIPTILLIVLKLVEVTKNAAK